jgi:hypothetical protein
MRKQRTQNSREPVPRGFVRNEWYEQVERIMRTDPARFRLFSPTTKYCLSVYLDLKASYQRRALQAA